MTYLWRGGCGSATAQRRASHDDGACGGVGGGSPGWCRSRGCGDSAAVDAALRQSSPGGRPGPPGGPGRRSSAGNAATTTAAVAGDDDADDVNAKNDDDDGDDNAGGRKRMKKSNGEIEKDDGH